MSVTQGRRIYCDDDGTFLEAQEAHKACVEAQPGDYWQYKGKWCGKLPNGLRCGLNNHQIVEHEDGTITVSPSILVTCPGAEEWNWHGYLKRGVWRSC